MLEVLQRADVTRLVEVATVRAALELPDSSHDDELADLVDGVSAAVESFLGRQLARQRYRETLAGRGRDYLLLARMPVERDLVTVTVAGVEEADFLLHDAGAGMLYLSGGWGGDDQDVVVTYTAGYLVPGVVATWSTAAEVAVGDWVRPTKPSLSPLLFQAAAVAGATAGAEPTWPTVVGEVVGDGGVTWTARAAEELPLDIARIAKVLAAEDFSGAVPGMTSERAEGYSATRSAAGETDLPEWAMRGLSRYPRVGA